MVIIIHSKMKEEAVRLMRIASFLLKMNFLKLNIYIKYSKFIDN